MKDVPENELFSAYLDGEITAEEQAQLEQLLAGSES
ncbi:MAG: zf-HC2 domain-containing protein, partial [Thermogutta sp.]|nr:zf-HC2 domain-containing protein [Thermogutta sp.]